MKITKEQLTQLIKEELEKSIEEEVVQEVYWPFIGGKVDANQLYRAKSRLEHSRERLNKYKSAMEDSDIRWADEWMSEMEEVLKSISKRHKKHEFEHAEKVWVRRQKDVEEILDAGSKAWNQQNRANSRDEYERESEEKPAILVESDPIEKIQEEPMKNRSKTIPMMHLWDNTTAPTLDSQVLPTWATASLSTEQRLASPNLRKSSKKNWRTYSNEKTIRKLE